MSTFSSMFLRAFRVCSPEFLDTEIEIIFKISEKLRYPKYFIECASQKARKTFYSVAARKDFDRHNLLVLPYSNCLMKVPQFCKMFNINVVFRFANTLKQTLIKNSPKNSLGCIYKIPCLDCSHLYIGQSGKGISTRIKQHQYSVRSGQESNALFLHRNNFNHRINWKDAEVVIYCNNITKRNIIESVLIKKSNELMNISQGMYKLDPFIIESIFKLVSF